MSMKRYILAIDQGTTGTTAVLVNAETGAFEYKADEDFAQIYPSPGWVEHDLNSIWQTVKNTITSVLKQSSVAAKQIVSIGITNQRETTCAFNNQGKPLANAIVWQDRRTSDFCQKNRDSFGSKLRVISGLPLDPYFSATKMQWLLKNSLEVANAAKENNLKFGTIDCYLLYRLTGGKSFATDATNASRTLLMNLKTRQWDDEALNFFGINSSYLPKIKDTFGHFGVTAGLDFLPDGVSIDCLIGDQQSALVGQAGLNKGSMKCTYGTGAFLLLNTGNEIVSSKHGLLTTLAYQYKGNSFYALEGSCYIAGAAVQWIRDNLNLFESSHEIEDFAKKADLTKMENVLFLPFFTGIGSPYWVSNSQAAIIGLTRDTNKFHISRACLEGISLSIKDIVTSFEKDTNSKISELKVDGGASANNFLMQIQSNFLEKKIIRPKNIETTGHGAALGALIGSGQINIDDVAKLWAIDKEFKFETETASYFKAKAIKWETALKKLYL